MCFLQPFYGERARRKLYEFGEGEVLWEAADGDSRVFYFDVVAPAAEVVGFCSGLDVVALLEIEGGRQEFAHIQVAYHDTQIIATTWQNVPCLPIPAYYLDLVPFYRLLFASILHIPL